MAKIIYKEGYEGQNKLSFIKGIEIELLNGQKALIYPKYAERQMLTLEQMSKWNAHNETEIEALKVEDTYDKTATLYGLDSPAADWVLNFQCEEFGPFYLPSLLAAMEIQHQKAEIDALAETIEGADLLRDFTFYILSCSRCGEASCWFANGNDGYANSTLLFNSCLVVPTILYR